MKFFHSTLLVVALLYSGSLGSSQVSAQTSIMRMAVTTSFHHSGLADFLLKGVEAELGFKVNILVVGTGQALRLGQAGDVDAVLVHSRDDEDRFVAEGYALYRQDVMYNDFVLIGPEDDRADVNSALSTVEAFQRIHSKKHPFLSRGDDSGTHKREVFLWQLAGIQAESNMGRWYKEVGAGMGTALNIASGMNGYILTDRASWLNFKNKGNLVILHDGDANLYNPYGYLPVNPNIHKHVKAKEAEKLGQWLVSESGQKRINAYKIQGIQVFFGNIGTTQN